MLAGSTLYGATRYGGSSGNGTLFKISADGTGFMTLYNFTATLDNSSRVYTNSDGANPDARLLLSGNILYGTAVFGGSSGNGTLFKISADGTGFTTLYNFTATHTSSFPFPVNTNSDGAYPENGLVLSGNTLYGIANQGGSSGRGTVFSLSLLPQLSITFSQAEVVLTWPTNYPGFTLQSTTNLAAPALWSLVSPVPVVVNGQNTVTNPDSGTQQFFRLIQ